MRLIGAQRRLEQQSSAFGQKAENPAELLVERGAFDAQHQLLITPAVAQRRGLVRRGDATAVGMDLRGLAAGAGGGKAAQPDLQPHVIGFRKLHGRFRAIAAKADRHRRIGDEIGAAKEAGIERDVARAGAESHQHGVAHHLGVAGADHLEAPQWFVVMI